MLVQSVILEDLFLNEMSSERAITQYCRPVLIIR